eukprot:s1822_g10.t1
MRDVRSQDSRLEYVGMLVPFKDQHELDRQRPSTTSQQDVCFGFRVAKRRLVIEPAEEKSNDVENVQAEAAKRTASKVRASEAKKRRKSGVLNAPGEAGSFEDALMS